MDIRVKPIRTLVRVEFPNKDHIDRTKLAALMGVTKSAVSQWLKNGVVHEKHIDRLRSVSMEEVWTDRKAVVKTKKEKPEGCGVCT